MQSAFPPIVGAPNDDDVKRLTEAFINVLQSIDVPGGAIVLSNRLLSDVEHETKQDIIVRFISDFRELNKRILRQPYTIPKIQDLLLRLAGFHYGTTLDLNMGYYHIELSAKSKELCKMGKYEYQRLSMGLCNIPDIFQ